MNHLRTSQGEGYEFYDYAAVAYNAGGGVEVAYVVGTNARAALPGLGALDAAAWPISETYPVVPPLFPGFACPHDAQDTHFYASSPCLIRLVPRNLVFRWVAALLAGAPWSAWPIPTVQIALRANVDYVYADKWAALYVVAQPAQAAGTLMVKASG